MGEIFSNEIFDMGNVFCFIDSKSSLNAPMSVETTQSGKRLVITFGVSGSSIYKNHGDKKTIPFCSGCTTITLFNDTKGIREISSGELRQNRIVMSEEFLRRNFSDIVKKFDKENLNLIKFGPANPRSLAFLNAIHSPKFSDKLSVFYIQSKILSADISYVGDNLTNAEVKFAPEYFYDFLKFMLENIPEHHYFYSPDAAWIMLIAMEGFYAKS